MKLKKVLELINNIGLLIFFCSIVASLFMHQTPFGFKHNDILRYMLYVGVSMTFPLYVYKFVHFKEYRKENIGNLIFLAIMILIIIYMIVFR